MTAKKTTSFKLSEETRDLLEAMVQVDPERRTKGKIVEASIKLLFANLEPDIRNGAKRIYEICRDLRAGR